MFYFRCRSLDFVDVLISQHTGLYPIVSKGMRLIAQGKDPLEGQRHMCGMGNLFHYHSTGFPELDELMRTPQPLIFIMELLQVSIGDSDSEQQKRRRCRAISCRQILFNKQLLPLFTIHCTLLKPADSTDKAQVPLCLKLEILYFPEQA